MTLLLTRAEVAHFLPMDDCIRAVEAAFRQLGEGRTPAPSAAAVAVPGGGFHVKAAAADGYFVAKTNGNFPGNPTRGLPTIQGLAMLCDATDGRVLAVMDSMELTALRTGAATAVAARVLARPESAAAAVIGCGAQALHQLRALAAVLPLRRVRVHDRVPARAEGFAREASRALGVEVVPVDSAAAAAREADVVATCTTGADFVLGLADVAPGTFVAGVGADSGSKRELRPELLGAARLVTDLREQCARIGDLHHALDAGVLSVADVHAELGEVVAGLRPGREHPEEITVFDSTGLAVQDVAAAAVVYRAALAGGGAARFEFG